MALPVAAMSKYMHSEVHPPPPPGCSHILSSGQRYWSVEDYADAYRSGRVKPSEVIGQRVLKGIRELEHLKMWAEVLQVWGAPADV